MKHIILALFFGISFLAWGQNDDITYHQAPNVAKNEPKKKDNKDFLERISVGGTGGLQVGTYTFVEISPHAAYHVNDYFSAGIGGSYFYYYDGFYKISTHVYGPMAFTEAHFLNYLGVHFAYQALNYENIISSFEKPRIWSNNLYMGGGYYQRAGQIAIYLYILYNFPMKDSFYSSPILFKTGFSVFLK